MTGASFVKDALCQRPPYLLTKVLTASQTNVCDVGVQFRSHRLQNPALWDQKMASDVNPQKCHKH